MFIYKLLAPLRFRAVNGGYHSNLFVGHPKLEGHGHLKLEGHVKASRCISGDHYLRSSCFNQG